MAHELEVVDGKASFASYRQPAWHKLGTVFTEPVKSHKTMLKKAHLAGWNVRAVDVAEHFQALKGERPYVFNTTPRLIVRDNPHGQNTIDVLGIVGERYEVFQNEEAFALLDQIVEKQGTWETAGSIKGGSVVFGSMTVDREIVLDPKGVADRTDLYLMVHTSHNGSKALGAMLTPVRVVCANTLNVALKGAKQQFNVRHTEKMGDRVEEARRVLGIVWNYGDVFEANARALFEAKITEDEFHKLFALAYPLKTDGQGATTRNENMRDKCVEIYHSDTCEGIRGTAWGALNALTERIDWHRTPRNGDPDANLRAASGFDPSINTKKNEIFELALDMFVTSRGKEPALLKPKATTKATKMSDAAAQAKAMLDAPVKAPKAPAKATATKTPAKAQKATQTPKKTDTSAVGELMTVGAAPRRGRPKGSKNAGRSSLYS